MQLKNLKILIIIPARKNSKRLKNKNLLKIKKKSLIQRTIDIAINITNKKNILVSTDSKKILKIAKKNKILAPWLRPKKLSTDKISSEKVVIHALNWYEKNFEKVNCVLLLQPTTPFRKIESIRSGLNLFSKNKNYSIISIKNINSSISFFKINKKNSKLSNIKKLNKDYFEPNGSFYIINPKILKLQKTFYIKKLKGVVLKSKRENIDIDDFYDLKTARLIKNNEY
jgi:CMP-N,N'-diacetyllegionaminic acid synthase